MTKQQAAAYVMAQSANMMTEMIAMQAANAQRIVDGHALAYGEDAFRALPETYGTHHNAVLTLFAQATEET